MAKFKDLTGNKYGSLTVIEVTKERRRNAIVWLCKCDCGNTHKVVGIDLTIGDVKSCGCQQYLPKHGMCKSVEYTAWRGMRRRCFLEKDPEYFRYGGAGITVCDRWLDSFENFFSDMGERPEGFSLDRINSSGDYEPDNCRWADNTTQSYNQKLSKRNTSGVAGVRYNEKINKWRVRICKKNKLLFNKHYEDYDEAVKVRQQLEIKYYGETRE